MTANYLDTLKAALKASPNTPVYIDVPMPQDDLDLKVPPIYTVIVVSSWLLAAIDDKYPDPPPTTVERWTTAVLYIREGPSTTYKVLDKLLRNTKIIVDTRQIQNRFIKLAYSVGWVSTDYLTDKKP